jgi:hypothetical protein
MPQKANNEMRKKVAHIIKGRHGNMVKWLNCQLRFIAKARKIDVLTNAMSVASIIGFLSLSKTIFMLFIALV